MKNGFAAKCVGIGCGIFQVCIGIPSNVITAMSHQGKSLSISSCKGSSQCSGLCHVGR